MLKFNFKLFFVSLLGIVIIYTMKKTILLLSIILVMGCSTDDNGLEKNSVFLGDYGVFNIGQEHYSFFAYLKNESKNTVPGTIRFYIEYKDEPKLFEYSVVVSPESYLRYEKESNFNAYFVENPIFLKILDVKFIPN